MIGFEVKINNNPPIKIASRSSHLFLSTFQNNVLLLMRGIDDNKNTIVWPNQVLKIGDKINVKVKDLDSIEQSFDVKLQDINEIKKRYLSLKLELEKRGLI
ncbi:hypothetical protein HMPREF0765_3831 [Sphingobacterium spiritivorum ATCC 33300]|uniref:Uncharacterized protein n=1 Tax=Sphingobacterium spiritivorum ATCC 33300 TaxID=525372 RepID=C2G2M5_SPHSI|nr:hypothetical protein [Sphingobacterium spiritivorum]EEI90515.1 hypothetical protein HMPREF0765_3831 [Sphingobacterium spiritivorum ATCC 33300]QQS95440.1 hypothetical protein I6J03_19005 [Sphingobacterium spiritivorum]